MCATFLTCGFYLTLHHCFSIKCVYFPIGRGKSGPALGGRPYGVPADAISVPADSESEIVKFTISIPRESCTNAKAKYSSSVVPPDPSVHFSTANRRISFPCIWSYRSSRIGTSRTAS